eukprot:COSAG05_NODE_9093_length_648_cov_0.828780_1_plen_105_part_00
MHGLHITDYHQTDPYVNPSHAQIQMYINLFMRRITLKIPILRVAYRGWRARWLFVVELPSVFSHRRVSALRAVRVLWLPPAKGGVAASGCGWAEGLTSQIHAQL